jgi:hypothetical protein
VHHELFQVPDFIVTPKHGRSPLVGVCFKSRAKIGDGILEGVAMAKYGKAASKSVKSVVHREKKGTLKSGKGGKGGRVKSRKQAIAIGLSEARKKGAKVPKKKSS